MRSLLILKGKSNIYWFDMSKLLIFCWIFCGNCLKLRGRVAEANKLFASLAMTGQDKWGKVKLRHLKLGHIWPGHVESGQVKLE